MACNFSERFADADFDEFLFALGDWSQWLIASKQQVTGEFYDGVQRRVGRCSYALQEVQSWGDGAELQVPRGWHEVHAEGRPEGHEEEEGHGLHEGPAHEEAEGGVY